LRTVHLTSFSVRAFAFRFVIALVLGGVILAAFIRTGNWYEDKKVKAIPRVVIPQGSLVPKAQDNDPGKPANYLIVGNDSRDFVKNDPSAAVHFGSASSQTGTRSDSIMIAHIDPRTKIASLVSIPRDTYITVPGCQTHDKINATFNSDWTTCTGRHGGPATLIDTISSNFGVPINHYMEVDFVGFQSIVNVIGHVSLYFPTPARDTYSGLFVETGGCQKLDGAQALAYARSRHYQWKSYTTGNWNDDPRSDLGRIARQQYFIRTLLQQALDSGARDLLKAKDMIDKIVPSLQVDQDFNRGDFDRLARAFHSLDPKSVRMLTVPTYGAVRNGQDVQLLQEPQADQIFSSVRGVSTPLAVPVVDPKTVTVDVHNAGAPAGSAAKALAALGRAGFIKGVSGNTTNVASTEVRVTADHRVAGLTLFTYLGGIGKVVVVPSTGAATVDLVLGPDFKSIIPPHGNGAVSGTTATTAPTTTTTGPTTTTTTIPPNPGDPLAGAKYVGKQIVGCK
jgi:LCP family protein required for cell wall assembly